MNSIRFSTLLLALALTGLAACQQEPAATVADKPLPESARSPGKPSAPVRIDYQVLGNAIVGQPVAIELRISSPLAGQPMTVNYFINDADSMQLSESQPATIDLSIPGASDVAARQVTVVPQREGRLYLNVTVEFETEQGSMLKSAAIPISVGEAADSAPVNGELQRGANGEAVISMPARES